MKFLIAFLFFAGVCAQDFVHITSYSDNNCTGTAKDLGYYVSGQCWGFDNFIYTELNETFANHVRYETMCMDGCTDCQINQNVALGACTVDSRTLTQQNPVVNTTGGIAFAFFSDASCNNLVSVVIPPSGCNALTAETSFYYLCNNNNDVEIYTCDTNGCQENCTVTSTFPTTMPECNPSTNMTYNLPTYFVPYCDVYPPPIVTTTTTTAAATTTTTEMTSTSTGSTSSSGTDNSTSTTSTGASSTTTTGTTTGATATSTGSTSAAATSSTTGNTTSATSTTTGNTTATSTTSGNATSTSASVTTTTTSGNATSTAAGTTTTTGNNTSTSASATTAAATSTSTTGDAFRITFGVLISAVCIAISLLI